MPKRSDLHTHLLGLVHQYLLSRGYEKTANRLAKESDVEIGDSEGHGSLLEIFRAHLKSNSIHVRSQL